MNPSIGGRGLSASHDMPIEPHDIDFVKSQSSFHRRTLNKWRDDDPRVKRHSEIATQFDILAEKLDHIYQNPAPKPQRAEIPGQLRLGNLEELPEELRSQIKISESDQLEMDIFDAVQGLDGVAAIDEILVALWHKTKIIQDRDFLSRKIYRMVQAKSLYSADKKGFYQMHDPDGEAALQTNMDQALQEAAELGQIANPFEQKKPDD